MKNKADILELLRSGDFTVSYHDNATPGLYKGKWKYEDLEDAEEIELANWEDGYCPQIVSLLVEALGGKSNST